MGKGSIFKKASFLLLTSVVLGACGEGEVQEIQPMNDPEPQEEVDMEQFRIDGDRVESEPVIDSQEREKRLVEQYETIDRPIIMNTFRHILSFDEKHEGAFDGVRMITEKSIDELKEEKLVEYKEHLGEPIHKEAVKIQDVAKVYPYVEDDFNSYYDTAVGILIQEVSVRVGLYDSIQGSLKNREFDKLRTSGVISEFQKSISLDGGLVEQVRPYIQEMDNLISRKRRNLGMEVIEYSDIEDEEDKVANYVTPKEKTSQEIIRTDKESDLYKESLEREREEQEEQESGS